MKHPNGTTSAPANGGVTNPPASAAANGDWRRKYGGWMAVIVVLAVLCVIPFHMGLSRVDTATVFFISVILAVSYRLLTTTGDWGFAHIIFQGVGAYAAALLGKHAGIPFIVMVPLAGLVTAAVGAIVMYPMLRTKGFGFFITSFAFGELIRMIWVKVKDPFGGVGGIINIPAPELFGLKLFSLVNYYFACMAFMVISVFIMWRLDRSRIGNAWKSIHTDHMLAECMGVNVARYRTLAFAVGSFFAGIAGALVAYRLGSIDPHNFNINEMIYLVIWVVVGGAVIFWGPLIGVTLLTVVFELSRELEEWRPMMFGGILILSLIFLPGGIESLLPALRRPPSEHYARFRKWLTTVRPG